MNLAAQLMKKNPEERLGFGKNFEALKSHPTFEDITYWDKFDPIMFLSELPKTEENMDIIDFITTSGEYNDSDAGEGEKLSKDEQDLFNDF